MLAAEKPPATTYSKELAAKPFLKWAGGKSRLVPLLLKAAPASYATYYEPFLGGGAMFFALQPHRAVLNDLNMELMNCFKIVREDPEGLFALLRHMIVNQEEFYRWRSMETSGLEPLTRAARFIYLNKTCYNGLYRVNKRGQFNTPFGNYGKINLADPDNLCAASRLLKSAELRALSYQESLSDAGPGDFVYLDPPYFPIGGFSDFKRYTAQSFYERDHERLAEVFSELDQRGCKVLLSNSKHPLMEHLYRGFKQVVVSMPRFVNCKGDQRGRVEELLVSNYEHDCMLP